MDVKIVTSISTNDGLAKSLGRLEPFSHSVELPAEGDVAVGPSSQQFSTHILYAPIIRDEALVSAKSVESFELKVDVDTIDKIEG